MPETLEIQKVVLLPLSSYRDVGSFLFRETRTSTPTEELWQVCGRYSDSAMAKQDLKYLRTNNPSKQYRLVRVTTA